MKNLSEEQIECTFAPIINNGRNGSRTLTEFLTSQQNFMQQRKERIQLIHQESMVKEQSNIRITPRIDKRSIILTERKKSKSKSKKRETVHERLFAHEKENTKQESAASPLRAMDVKKTKTDGHVKKKIGKEIEELCAKHCGETGYIEDLETFCKIVRI